MEAQLCIKYKVKIIKVKRYCKALLVCTFVVDGNSYILSCMDVIVRVRCVSKGQANSRKETYNAAAILLIYIKAGTAIKRLAKQALLSNGMQRINIKTWKS